MSQLIEDLAGRTGCIVESEIGAFVGNVKELVRGLTNPETDLILFHVSLPEGNRPARVEACVVGNYVASNETIVAQTSDSRCYMVNINKLSVINRDDRGQNTMTTMDDLESVLSKMFINREQASLTTPKESVVELIRLLKERKS